MTSSADVWVETTEITRAYLEADHERALRDTDALLERYPDRLASLLQIRAEVLVQLGRPDEARAAATQVLVVAGRGRRHGRVVPPQPHHAPAGTMT